MKNLHFTQSRKVNLAKNAEKCCRVLCVSFGGLRSNAFRFFVKGIINQPKQTSEAFAFSLCALCVNYVSFLAAALQSEHPI
jgi:hypothetical protein